nr:scarecrow-like protein 4 [Ipomoea batatas]
MRPAGFAPPSRTLVSRSHCQSTVFSEWRVSNAAWLVPEGVSFTLGSMRTDDISAQPPPLSAKDSKQTAQRNDAVAEGSSPESLSSKPLPKALLGDPTERVAYYFSEALYNRLSNSPEKRPANFEASSKFAHLTANQVILEATEKASSKIHIIDPERERAVGALANLAVDDKCSMEIATIGGVHALIILSQNKAEGVQEQV